MSDVNVVIVSSHSLSVQVKMAMRPANLAASGKICSYPPPSFLLSSSRFMQFTKVQYFAFVNCCSFTVMLILVPAGPVLEESLVLLRTVGC